MVLLMREQPYSETNTSLRDPRNLEKRKPASDLLKSTSKRSTKSPNARHKYKMKDSSRASPLPDLPTLTARCLTPRSRVRACRNLCQLILIRSALLSAL